MHIFCEGSVVRLAIGMETLVRTSLANEGSLEVADFSINEIEYEAARLHAEEGLKVAKAANIPGQIMTYQGEVAAAETYKTLALRKSIFLLKYAGFPSHACSLLPEAWS